MSALTLVLGLIIQWVLWGTLMHYFMRWLARSRVREPERTADGVVLRNPKSTLIVGVVCTMLCLGASIACLCFLDGGAVLASMFLSFAAMGALVIADYFMDRFEVKNDGLSYQTTLGGAGFALWADIVSVKYQPNRRWFRMDFRGGAKTRVSALLTGLPAFATAVLAHASGAKMDAETRAIVEATANNQPPNIGG